MRWLRNIAIIAVVALLLTVLPAGGNLAAGVLAALSMLFIGAIAMLAVQYWKRSSLTRDAMSERQRLALYASLGAIALMIAGTDELLGTGLGTITWLVVLGVSGWLIFNTWREANSI